jgi:uncharacterized protein (UPF0276 family)
LPEISVTYSSDLHRLARDERLSFGYVRLGSWLDEPSCARAIEQFSDKTLLYHYNGPVRVAASDQPALIAALERWQNETRCPWLSIHLDFNTPQEFRAILEGQRAPVDDEDLALEWLCDAVGTLKSGLRVPLLLENMQQWSLPQIALDATPRVISRTLERTDCGLLLDIAHARIAADLLGYESPQSYLAQLPLERVVELHVSSPRVEGDQWINAHAVMTQEDYAILEWLLERCSPRAITLEYWREPDQVVAQVRLLNELLARVC